MEISIGLLRVGELVMIDFQIFEDMIVPTYPRINVNLRRKIDDVIYYVIYYDVIY